jgi:hypothetical protein
MRITNKMQRISRMYLSFFWVKTSSKSQTLKVLSRYFECTTWDLVQTII